MSDNHLGWTPKKKKALAAMAHRRQYGSVSAAAGVGLALAAFAFSPAVPAAPASLSTGGAISLKDPNDVISPAPQGVHPIPPTATTTIGVSDATGQKNSGVTANAGVIPNANPGIGACATPVTSHGGPVMQHPSIGTLFWGSAWSSGGNPATRTAELNSINTLAKGFAFWNRLAEYGVTQSCKNCGTFNSSGPIWTSGQTGNIAETTIQAGLKSAITAPLATGFNYVYLPDPGNMMFLIMLPPGTTSARDVTNGWSGHHDHFSATFNGHNADVKYAVIEPNLGDTLAVVSHELMETASDPDFNAYYWQDASHEIGDLCRGVAFPGGPGHIQGQLVETVWSAKDCNCVMEKNLNSLDFNGSGAPNRTVFRSGVWIPNGGSPNWNFLGVASDIPYSGDYDGDGRTEFALFRDGFPGSVFVLDVKAGSFNSFSFGNSGDVPVPGDYDGDGITDLAVWTPSSGNWQVKFSSTGALVTQQWGLSTDIPVPGDYDGDHRTDFAILRPSSGTWWIQPSSGAGFFGATWTPTFGDIPTPGDFNGDSKADFAYWHPADQTFHVSYNGSPTAFIQQWGIPGDIPVCDDYDGDYQTDMAVWRPSSGTWFTINSTTNAGVSLQWGVSTDTPVQHWPPR